MGKIDLSNKQQCSAITKNGKRRCKNKFDAYGGFLCWYHEGMCDVMCDHEDIFKEKCPFINIKQVERIKTLIALLSKLTVPRCNFKFYRVRCKRFAEYKYKDKEYDIVFEQWNNPCKRCELKSNKEIDQAIRNGIDREDPSTW